MINLVWRAAWLLPFCLAHATTAATETPGLQLSMQEPGLALLDPGAVRQFYERREYRAAWLGPRCRKAVNELLLAIDIAFEHGLDPAQYHRDALAATSTCSKRTEWLATDAWMALASHLHAGRVDPVAVEPHWTASRPETDMAVLLESALSEGRLVAGLLGLAPDDSNYAAMREALARFRGYLGRGGWTGVDDGPSLRLGDDDPRVSQLRQRLRLSGLLTPAQAEDEVAFDAGLEAAVMAFQRRANLEPDGVVGKRTLAQLNRRAIDRIDQLRVNLERWRWMPEDIGARHIRVNIADFSLQAWGQGRVERTHKVIVGRLFRSTPSFSGRINRLVFNPWWETPRSLAVQDKLPLFKRDPGAVDRLGFEVIDSTGVRVDSSSIDWQGLSASSFPYRLRQRPGVQNALGQVKILFPNVHSVYLHDTPTRGLFSRVRRDFSSGCIRVEDALGLSEWLLQDMPGWDRDRIDVAISSGAERSVSLRPSVQVHLQYLTVVPDDTGGVRFIDDLYQRDAAVLAALDSAGQESGSDPSM